MMVHQFFSSHADAVGLELFRLEEISCLEETMRPPCERRLLGMIYVPSWWTWDLLLSNHPSPKLPSSSILVTTSLFYATPREILKP